MYDDTPLQHNSAPWVDSAAHVVTSWMDCGVGGDEERLIGSGGDGSTYSDWSDGSAGNDIGSCDIGSSWWTPILGCCS